MILTIAIPIYNESEFLLGQLKKLFPLIGNNLKINVLIIDNNSDIDIEFYIKKKIDINKYSNKINFVRNSLNIGGDANILKCFLLCQTEWLWVLSANDYINENAINIILNDIKNYNEAVYINYPGIKNNILTIGFKEFCSKIPSYSRSFFISACVYNLSKLKSSLPKFYELLSSNQGQLMIILDYLSKNQNAICLFSKNNLLDNETKAKWDRNKFIQNSMLIFNSLDDYNSNKIFNETLGLEIINLLLYYNCVNRIEKKVRISTYLSNFFKLLLSSSKIIFTKRITYKIFFISFFVLFLPLIYKKYFYES
jgi:hypothetical protein